VIKALLSKAVLFNLFHYGEPLKMFWWTQCTLFTDASPCSPRKCALYL